MPSRQSPTQSAAEPAHDGLSAPDGTCYSDTGEGEPVVLLHGLGLDRHMWLEQSSVLGASRRVIALDSLGHGGSPAPPAGFALQHLVAQLTDLLDALDIGAAALVGFDLGGQVAIAAAARAPERVERLALISTAHARLKAQRDLARQRIQQARRHGPGANADSAIQRWFSAAYQATHPERVEAVRARLASNDPVGYLAASEVAVAADAETARDARSVRCPTLIMCGALDVDSTPSGARHLAGAIAAAELAIVPKQRHMLPLEAPALVNSTVADFLARPA